MKRRQFLELTAVTLAGSLFEDCATGWSARRGPWSTDAAAFGAARRLASLSCGRIAYVERGAGPAALFLHGAPLNGFQWRGAIERLAGERRCVAPDFMGLGYSEANEGQPLTAAAQAEMLLELMDALRISTADFVASDSGGAVAQVLLARHPERVRSLLLTNCDVEPDSPPEKVKPAIELARAGKLADATAGWLADKALARATFAAAVFRDPSHFTDDAIDYYVTPLVSSPLRRAQYHAFHLALEPNPLAGLEATLKQRSAPVRIVWGEADDIFSIADAEYLDRLFPRSRGLRRVPGAKLFFPEEFPEIIAEEARALWRQS